MANKFSSMTTRELASTVHAGMWSALYAYGSSGTITRGLDTEIKTAINEFTGAENRDLRRALRDFLAEIEVCCDVLRAVFEVGEFEVKNLPDLLTPADIGRFAAVVGNRTLVLEDTEADAVMRCYELWV